MKSYDLFVKVADNIGHEALASELYNYMSEDDRLDALRSIIREYDLDFIENE